MNANPIILICTPLTFFSQHDENAFFGWLAKVSCVNKIQGIGPELHLYIKNKRISKFNLLELMGIFERYRFNKKQLEIFKNEKNKHYFEH